MTETLQELRQNRNALKVIALRERIATLVTQYEDQDADRRVEITAQQERIEALKARVAELELGEVTEDVVQVEEG